MTMSNYLVYLIVGVVLLVSELLYFRIADHFNIIDRPNQRSSHTTIVLRGGGIVFLVGVWVWSIFFGFHYPVMLVAVTLAAGVSFADDVRSLPDSVRLVIQFTAMGLLIWQLFQLQKTQVKHIIHYSYMEIVDLEKRILCMR